MNFSFQWSADLVKLDDFTQWKSGWTKDPLSTKWTLINTLSDKYL